MEIKDLKTHLKINQVLANYQLNPHKNYRICCPFHEDKTPSMQVIPIPMPGNLPDFVIRTLRIFVGYRI